MAKEKEKLKHTNYSIGLDIGTNSVGWAVVDENMNLVKRCKKHLWGSRLFDERETAKNRRIFRTTRRRLLRRRIRIAILNKLLQDFVGDQNFFVRMEESFLQKNDRTLQNKYTLFDEESSCDIKSSDGKILYTITKDDDFYKLFPTIYHLRKSIIEHQDWIFAPKLVYLAIHHILKSRGNFINESLDSKNSDDKITDEDKEQEIDINKLFVKILQDACDIYDVELENIDEFSEYKWIKNLSAQPQVFLDVLQNNDLSKKEKIAQIKQKFNCGKDDTEIESLLNLLLGNSADINKIFQSDTKEKFKFSDGNIDEKILASGDYSQFLEDAKNLYSLVEYQRIMQGKNYLSDVMIERYNRYKQQLKDLKTVFLAIYPKQNGKMHPEYRKFFRDLKTVDGYARYTYSVNSCDEKKFKSTIIGAIKNNEQKIISAGICAEDNQSIAEKAKKILICLGEYSAKDGKEQFFVGIDFTDKNFRTESDRQKQQELGFLQRPRVAGNGIFPKQAHQKELDLILKNQSVYWGNFLNKKTDFSNNTIQEDIKKLFNFKIDYYVGPLGISKNGTNNFGWVVRKEGFSEITPFNYYDAVDFEKTRKNFIERMSGNCSYILNKKALPKNSMYYCYFNVLNELCNISILIKDKLMKLHEISLNGKNYFDIIIDKLLESNTFKQKDLLHMLAENYVDVSIRGFANDEKLNSNLKSIRDMARIFEDRKLNHCEIMEFLGSEKASMYEDVIRDVTIFGESKKALKESLSKYHLKEDEKEREKQINAICELNYSGWGNLSKELIFDIKSENSGNTILKLMENEHRNFMSIYMDKRYGFDEQVKKLNEVDKPNVLEQINSLVCSPSVKRGVNQAYKIMEELVQVMGHAPQNVFLEFARGGDSKKKGSVIPNRQKQIDQKYKNAKALKDGLYEKYINADGKLNENISLLSQNDKENDKLKNKFDNEKVVLYFLQMGRCMYSNEILDLNHISEYEVDHIVPQSIIDDNSFDNKVLVKVKRNQQKSNGILEIKDSEVTKLWKELRKMGLLTVEKYDRLLKLQNGTLLDNTAGFVARQLVETRQIIKNTAEILKDYFKEYNAKSAQINAENQAFETSVYPVKAEMNSIFRQKFGYPKGEGGRAINDFHHAKDAYITTVMGTYMLNHWHLDDPKMWFVARSKKNEDDPKFECAFYQNYIEDIKAEQDTQNPQNTNKSGMIVGSMKKYQDKNWCGSKCETHTNITIKDVLNNFDRNYYSADCYYSRKIDSKPTGAFYDQTIYKSDKNLQKFGYLNKNGKKTGNSMANVSLGKIKKPIIPYGENGIIKINRINLDAKKYGGYSSVNPAKFAVIKEQNKNKYKFISIPALITCPTSIISLKEYLQNKYPNYEIVRLIPKYTILSEEQFGKVIISGEKDKHCANQLQFSRENKELYRFIYLVFKYLKKENKIDFVDYLLSEKQYPILTIEQKEIFTEEQNKKYIQDYIYDCIKRFQIEYITHLKEKHILKNLANTFEQYFNEILKSNSDITKLVEIIPELLKITQCNGARADLNKFSTKSLKLGECGRIAVAIPNLENTYIIHNSITGIYCTKEKIIKNTQENR